jgi:hypothetical protein
MIVDPIGTTDALRGLVKMQGGDYHTDPTSTTYPSSSTTYMTAVHTPANYVPFSISMYNVQNDEIRYSLDLMVNPSDIQFGHSQAFQNVYTRKGWVSTYWGNQLRTITVSGSSAGFYYNPNQVKSTVDGLKIHTGGLSNYNRRNSLAFANLFALISFFKRNGAYFLNDVADQTFWKDGTSRVINVMDFVMISYDGTDHLGGFNSFTIDDNALNPYRISYNFDFVVAGLRGDPFDGHLRKDNNDLNPRVEVSLQGDDMELTKTVRMDENELNKYYKMPKLSATTGEAYLKMPDYAARSEPHPVPPELQATLKTGYTCTYSQSTGLFTCKDSSGTVVFAQQCYSGKGDALNNPNLESVYQAGPIPRGVWVIDSTHVDTIGPYTVNLTPVGNNNVFSYGREASAFRIHGDTTDQNQTASKGCIIMGGVDFRRTLVEFAGTKGALLIVTE